MGLGEELTDEQYTRFLLIRLVNGIRKKWKKTVPPKQFIHVLEESEYFLHTGRRLGIEYPKAEDSISERDE